MRFKRMKYTWEKREVDGRITDKGEGECLFTGIDVLAKMLARWNGNIDGWLYYVTFPQMQENEMAGYATDFRWNEIAYYDDNRYIYPWTVMNQQNSDPQYVE